MVSKTLSRGFTKSNMDPAKKGPYNTKMKYHGKEAYTFPHGPSHTSPCMDPYIRSPEYQAKKERWLCEAGIITGTAISIDHDHDEKPDDETEEDSEDFFFIRAESINPGSPPLDVAETMSSF